MRGGKANKTGRTPHGPPFVQLHNFMLDSPAWGNLSSQERAVYLVLARLYNGANNGYLGLGVRGAAAAANINKDTARRCFVRLQEVGFVECTTPAKFGTNSCLAPEWRLTAYRCDRTMQAASKAFMKWRPAPEVSPKRGSGPSETRDSGDRKWA